MRVSIPGRTWYRDLRQPTEGLNFVAVKFRDDLGISCFCIGTLMTPQSFDYTLGIFSVGSVSVLEG